MAVKGRFSNLLTQVRSVKSAVKPLLQRLDGVYRDPSRVSRDAGNLLDSFQGQYLVPNVSSLKENSGSEHPLVLALSGTIEMTYKGGNYNIPVEIFLPPAYPMCPPVCFVRPTVDMLLKEKHKHVARDGMVYMPYLHEWHKKRSTLTEMVVMMSKIFGENPPCYNNPEKKVPNDPPCYKNPEKQVPEQPKKQADEAKEEQETRTRLNSMVQTCLTKYYDEALEEMISDTCTFRELKRNSEVIDKRRKQLKTSNSMISSLISVLDQMKDMQQESVEAERQEKSNVGKRAIPANVYPRQLLELVAKNALITDCLYYLDESLVRGHIKLDEHIKQVRQLGRQQFLIRAQIQKINQAKFS